MSIQRREKLFQQEGGFLDGVASWSMRKRMRGEEGEWREWRGGLEGEPGEASLTSTDLAASPESPLLPSPEGVKVGIQQRICGTEQPDGGRRQNPLCWGYSLVPRVGPMLWVCPLPHTVTLG